MRYNVSLFDLVEVNYTDPADDEKVEYFSGSMELAKEFIRDAIERGCKVSSATYFIEAMISSPESSVAKQPAKRFAETQFSPNSFLLLPPDWAENARMDANDEIDAYMAEVYGSTYQA